MKTLIAIIGRSGSGKDSLKNYIKEKYKLREVVSYTTRPMRDNEVEGREHYFISKDKMTELIKNDELIAYLDMSNPSEEPRSGYEYGSTIDEVLASDMYIIDPLGLDKLKNNIKRKGLNINVVSIYIKTNNEVRKNRIINSDRFKTTEDGENEWIKREHNEKHLFDTFEKNEEYDYIIDNSNSLSNALKQIDIIMRKIRTI